MSLGSKIARLRKLRDWTQEDLAEKLGMHPAHLSRLENDKMRPKPPTVARLADIFDLDVGELLAEEEEDVPLEDPILLKAFQKAQHLDNADKRLVLRMVSALLTQKRLVQLVHE